MILKLEIFMKKKILSVLCGIFMFVFSVFLLTSCSMLKINSEKQNSQAVLKVGDVTLTRSDIISSFYTYYQNNSNYFAYYDDSTIEESFYTWSIIREILNQKANEALYDATTNPNGKIFYTSDVEAEVWESAFEYVYSQVSSYEKAIYSVKGVEEDDYPVWLKSEEDDDEDDTKFEAYKTSKPDEPDSNRKNNVVQKATDDYIKENKVSALKTYLFEFVYEKAEDDDGDDVRKPINESGYDGASETRTSAFARYMESLRSSAISQGNVLSDDELFENELIRVYNAYYKSEIQTLYQNYLLEEELVSSDLMSDKAVVNAFINQYLADKQEYMVETEYVAEITSTDSESVILYHYNGQNYFFTVQQILVKFDDNQTNMLKDLDGYSSSEIDSTISDVYKQNRENFATSLDASGALLTEINEDTGIESITILGDYYYYDEALKNSASDNYGYKKLTKSTTEDDVYTDASGNEYKRDEVKYMATKTQVLNTYKSNFQTWTNVFEQYFNALVNEDTTEQNQIKTNNPKMESYIFETVENMQKNGKTIEEVKEKIASYLFLELEWIYTGDSLGNDYSNKRGYVVSNYKGENSSWVADFAVGARKLLSQYTEPEIQGFISSGDVDNLVSCVTTDYGYHLLKIENVYKAEGGEGYSPIDMSGVLASANNLTAENVANIVAKMKSTYVCTSSNQTVYDYFYDKLYEEYTGSSGYFLNLEYAWLNDYYENNKLEYINVMSYTDLVASINS